MLVIAIVAALILVRPRATGPSYQGKALSAWIEQLPAKGDKYPGIIWAPLAANHTRSQLEAIDALQHLGTNAIPFLMDEMRTQNIELRDRIEIERVRISDFIHQKIFNQSSPLLLAAQSHKTSAELRHWDAARGLNALGLQASVVIPELSLIMNHDNNRSADAAYALAGMGPDGTAALLQSYTNNYNWVAMCAVWAMGQCPTNRQAALPKILLLLNDKDEFMRMAATWSLGEIRSDPVLVAPALAANLADIGSNMRQNTDAALRKYGIQSTSFEAVTNYLNDPELYKRMVATNAIRVLYPQDAAKYGIH